MALKFNKEQEDYLQCLWKVESSKSSDASTESSSLRSKLFLLLDAPNHENEHTLDFENSLMKYTNVVDQMDDTGLNNYAEGALALCSHHRNESNKWRSELNISKVLKECNLKENSNSEEMMCKDFDPVITFQGIPDQRSNKLGINASSKFSSFEQNQDFKPSHLSNKTSLHLETPCSVSSTKDVPINSSSNRSLFTLSKETDQKRIDGALYPPYPKLPPGFSKEQTSSNKTFNQSNYFKPNHPEINNRDSVFKGKSLKTYDTEQDRDSNLSPKTNKVIINSQKNGGPFANFGQKRKQTDQAWMKGKWKASSTEDNAEEFEDGQDSSVNNRCQSNPFRTAKQQLVINKQKKNQSGDRGQGQVSTTSYGTGKRSLGTRRGPGSKFIPPVLNRDSDENSYGGDSYNQQGQGSRIPDHNGQDQGSDECVDERLKGIDPKMIELINNEIMDHGTQITWDDIAGLDFAKKTIKEIVVWPMLRPDIFTGLRGPPKGLLLFGPPGTGKTLIGKCIASQSKSTFFCISASSLTSKWVGEGEKMVKALFAVARVNQPAVIFIDEIDSLLSQRSDNEHESSRRIKTEFLVQLDGAATGSEDRILVIGATNRPQEIDEAARRRFVKRLLIPLPEAVARRQIVCHLMSQQNSDLTETDVTSITEQSDGYSGADMTNLCREAALGPIRSIPLEEIETITSDQVRPIIFEDFQSALLQVRASVSSKDLQLYEDWNRSYGSFGH